MTIETVKAILAGEFTDPADRDYWEKKLADLERKAKTAEVNERYFIKSRRYAR